MDYLSLVMVILGSLILWIPGIDIDIARKLPFVNSQNFMIANYSFQFVGSFMMFAGFFIIFTNI